MSNPSTPPTVAVDLRPLVRSVTGIGVYTRSLLLELAGRGEHRFLGLAHGPVEGSDEFAAADVPIEVQTAPLGVIWQQLRLPPRLARGDVDLLWSPHMTLPLRCPVPAVATVHDLTTLLLPEHHRVKVRWSVYPFLRSSLDQARRVIADSEATANDLRFHFPEVRERLAVIYPGVDPEFLPADLGAIDETRRELGAPDGYILYAGTLEPRKNVGALLDAWEALRADDPAAPPLVLVGPYGWRSSHLLERIRALASAESKTGPALVHLGAVERSRLVRIVQAARIFVYPSLYEGFGLPVAEALAAAVPTVASNRTSLPEVVGDAGLLFDPDDRGALAFTLRRLLADPGLEAELAARGPARAARFAWRTAADQLTAAFAEARATG